MESWQNTFRKVGRKPLIAAVLALAMMALSGIQSFRNALQLIATTSKVSTIHATISNEKELLARLNQAEGGLFGFVITGNSNFVATYTAATNAIPTILDFVRTGIEDSTDAQFELGRLEKLIAERLGQMQSRIDLYLSQGPSAVAELVRKGDARVLMEEIRSSINILIQFEVERLNTMELRAMSDARLTLVVDGLFGSVSVLVLAAIVVWLFRENVSRKKSEEDLRQAGRELEMRVAQRTADLAAANASLQVEIAEHRRAEEAVRASEQKLAEAARALADKNKDLEMLIYVASHDLRAPLLNIRGFTSELARSCEDAQRLIERAPGATLARDDVAGALADIPESIGFIQTGVAKMDALLSGFLRLSRLGRAALRIGRVDMNALMSTVSQSFAFQFREAGGEIHVDRLPKCAGDATQLGQVFSNLVDNALKYRDLARPLHVEVTGEVVDGMVAYSVRDNGIGIPADHLDRVFEIFHRVNGENIEGEGLGLTIARRILDRQNGRLAVQSKAGEGSAFTVYLPVPERD